MWHLLRQHTKLLVVWGLFLAVVAGIISLVLPKQYSAVSQVLIISRSQGGVDPYTQAKAAEQIGQNLAQVMQTSDFYNKVMQSTGVTFDKTRWQNLSDRKQRTEWQKDVKATVVYNTSLLGVTVYAPSQEEAANFSNAVTQTITSQGWQYVGGDVSLKQVDNPLVSRLPARPNIIFNTILGFVVGVLLCGLWVIKYKKHLVFG